MKTQDLIGPALDYAVAKIEGTLPASFDNWEQTYPWYSVTPKAEEIIDREKIDTAYDPGDHSWEAIIYLTDEYVEMWGPTRRIAAMRCYVASKLGDEVDIPEELQ